MIVLVGGRTLLLVLASLFLCLSAGGPPGSEESTPVTITTERENVTVGESEGVTLEESEGVTVGESEGVEEGESGGVTVEEGGCEGELVETREELDDSSISDVVLDSNHQEMIEGDGELAGDDYSVTMEREGDIAMVTEQPNAVLEPPTEPPVATPVHQEDTPTPLEPESHTEESPTHSGESGSIPDQMDQELETTPTEEEGVGVGDNGDGGGSDNGDEGEGDRGDEGEGGKGDEGEGEVEEGDDVPTFTEFSQRKRMEQNSTQRVATGRPHPLLSLSPLCVLVL